MQGINFFFDNFHLYSVETRGRHGSHFSCPWPAEIRDPWPRDISLAIRAECEVGRPSFLLNCSPLQQLLILFLKKNQAIEVRKNLNSYIRYF